MIPAAILEEIHYLNRIRNRYLGLIKLSKDLRDLRDLDFKNPMSPPPGPTNIFEAHASLVIELSRAKRIGKNLRKSIREICEAYRQASLALITYIHQETEMWATDMKGGGPR